MIASAWRVAAVAAFVGTLGAAPLSGVSVPPGRFPVAAQTTFGTVPTIGENDAGAVLGGVQIFVAAGLDRQNSAQSGVSALVAECVLRTPVGPTGAKLALRDAIANVGASINETVDGRSVHYYIEARGETLAAAIRLFAQAIAAPDFSAPTLGAARATLTARANDADESALNAAIQMFRRSYYASGAGLPALGNATTLANLDARAVGAFYAATYVRTAVTASTAGNVTPAVGTAIAALAAALPDAPVTKVVESAHPIPSKAPRIIARRDVGAPWIVVGYAAPAPGSRDFGAMLVMESLLSNAFERDSATTLGFVEKSVGAFYLYDSTPASLVFYVNGSQIDPSRALFELTLVSKALANKPLDASALARYKNVAEGHFLTDSVSLSDRSYLLGTFASQGLGNDSVNAALAALEHTSAADVQRVAKQYMQRYIVALVLPRQSPSQ